MRLAGFGTNKVLHDQQAGASKLLSDRLDFQAASNTEGDNAKNPCHRASCGVLCQAQNTARGEKSCRGTLGLSSELC